MFEKRFLGVLVVGFAVPVGAGQDVTVDSGEVHIGNGDSYDSVVVVYPGRVTMTGGRIAGLVRLEGYSDDERAAWTMTGGVIAGGVELDGGDLYMTGGRVEGGITGAFGSLGGSVVAEDAEVTGSISFDESPASVTVDRSVIGSIAVSGRGSWSVTDSTVMGGLAAGFFFDTDCGGEVRGSEVGGEVSAGPLCSVVVDDCSIGSGQGVTIRGSIVSGSVRQCDVAGSDVRGNAIGSRVAGLSIVRGNFSAIDSKVQGALADSRVLGTVRLDSQSWAPEGSTIFGRLSMELCESFVLSGTKLYGGAMIGPFSEGAMSNTPVVGELSIEESYVDLAVYRLVIDGQPVGLGSPVDYPADFGDPVAYDAEVIWTDGRRSDFRLSFPTGYGLATFTGAPLEGGGCSLADVAAPFGVLDLVDVVSFAGLFELADPAADLAEPFGVVDITDVSAFVELFLGGCP
ncbi:MAG: hypothetical protein H6810_05170 [Phycisphaeraceae bacterium]|nr:MAG: hypothetical protein H6810_05170 [Phycisphaeraceae bacterium]